MKFINYKDSELFIDEKPNSDPINNQVQIEIYSSSVNRADLLQKKGHYPPPKGESEILGLECAGIISKIGNTSKRFKVGDKVCAILGGGGYVGTPLTAQLLKNKRNKIIVVDTFWFGNYLKKNKRLKIIKKDIREADKKWFKGIAR